MQNTYSQDSQTQIQGGIEAIQADFMTIAYDLYQEDSTQRKKSKAQRRAAARRAIEEYQEQRKLAAQIKETWED